MPEAGTDKLGIITENTPSNEELDREILGMIPISVSDGYGRFAALYYTECLYWIQKTGNLNQRYRRRLLYGGFLSLFMRSYPDQHISLTAVCKGIVWYEFNLYLFFFDIS